MENEEWDPQQLVIATKKRCPDSHECSQIGFHAKCDVRSVGVEWQCGNCNFVEPVVALTFNVSLSSRIVVIEYSHLPFSKGER